MDGWDPFGDSPDDRRTGDPSNRPGCPPTHRVDAPIVPSGDKRTMNASFNTRPRRSKLRSGGDLRGQEFLYLAQFGRTELLEDRLRVPPARPRPVRLTQPPQRLAQHRQHGRAPPLPADAAQRDGL